MTASDKARDKQSNCEAAAINFYLLNEIERIFMKDKKVLDK